FDSSLPCFSEALRTSTCMTPAPPWLGRAPRLLPLQWDQLEDKLPALRTTRVLTVSRGKRQIALAISLSLFFCTLPVDVLGSSAKTTWLGTLKRARRSRHQAMSSSAVAVLPARSSTKAHGRSPHFSSGLATTAAAATAGCL